MTERSLDAVCREARSAADQLAGFATSAKNAALQSAADALRRATIDILSANAVDVAAARAAAMAPTLLDRLTLTSDRIAAMASGLEAVAALPDPVGTLLEEWTRPNGLDIRRVRVPLGVIAVIYEARPNVTSDVAALCLKSGNAAILRGSSMTLASNRAIVAAMQPALAGAGLPDGTVQLLTDTTHSGARELMQRTGDIDLLIPRGGARLIADIRENARVPFVIDGDGNCHVYVDAAADLDMAERIVVNAKVSRPSVCNSAEKLLVHRDVAAEFVPRIVAVLQGYGVEVRADARVGDLAPGTTAATPDDWSTEYLDMVMAVRVVDSLDDAVRHIRTYGSGHTEAIVSADTDAARRFVDACPAAVVMVNASTRFTDGGEFGYGAEIGNSTQRLHARGPMGLRELTTYRIEVWGDGQTRS